MYLIDSQKFQSNCVVNTHKVVFWIHSLRSFGLAVHTEHLHRIFTYSSQLKWVLNLLWSYNSWQICLMVVAKILTFSIIFRYILVFKDTSSRLLAILTVCGKEGNYHLRHSNPSVLWALKIETWNKYVIVYTAVQYYL